MKNIYTESSRYYEKETVTFQTKSGKNVTALKLRQIFKTSGKLVVVEDSFRLDMLSQQYYDNPTKFWYIADSNTALDSNELIKRKNNQLPVIEVPLE